MAPVAQAYTTHSPPTATPDTAFGAAVRAGLSKSPKAISSKYLYDSRGSELFVEITRLEEYYLSRCEEEIFLEQAKDIVAALGGHISEVVELGCGDGFKTERLLKALCQVQESLAFVPVDICQDSIDLIENRMRNALPQLNLSSFTGDYNHFLNRTPKAPPGSRLVLFLGSNIGNFTAKQAELFVKQIYEFCQPGDYLLLGLDLKKDLELLHAAYNDQRGITSEFNFNLLDRMNRELGANFDRDTFSHHGYYNVEIGAMQSYLVSNIAQEVQVDALNMVANFDCLEAIHIEDSHKYSLRDVHTLAQRSGFEVHELFCDSQGYFVDALLRKL